MVPAEPRALSGRTQLAPLEVQRFEERHPQAEQIGVPSVTRTPRRDAEDIHDARGTIAEQDDTISEVYGLVEVMGHQHQGRPVARPRRQQVILARHGAAWGVWQIPEDEIHALGEVAGKDVLELGCGAAQWSIELAGRGARPVGLDLSERQLEHAR